MEKSVQNTFHRLVRGRRIWARVPNDLWIWKSIVESIVTLFSSGLESKMTNARNCSESNPKMKMYFLVDRPTNKCIHNDFPCIFFRRPTEKPELEITE